MANLYNFSDIFISYSRQDVAFAKQIGETLKARGYEIWADWEDIPQTVDWWNEIRAGIEAADSFAFIISPAAAASSVCQDEIRVAAESNKRIIPILYQKLSDAELEGVHPAIKTHNWFVFDDSSQEAFETSLQRLIKTLRMDVGHIRAHTRYLVRAREWQDHNHDDSYLLRGSDAYEAGAWLVGSDGRTPAPVGLHRDYIAASQRQVELDAQLEQRQRTIQFVDRTTWPPFWFSFIGAAQYVWFVFPDEDLQGLDRLALAFGGGVVVGILVAATALYADELLRIRFEQQPRLRFLGSFAYSLILSAALCGIVQSVFFTPPISLVSIFIAAFLLGLGFIMRATFKLSGWQAAPIVLFGWVAGSTLTMEMGNGFSFTGLSPIFYFENWTEYWLNGVLTSLLVAIGAFGWSLWEGVRTSPQGEELKLKTQQLVKILEGDLK